MSSGETVELNHAQAARKVEIFLDYLLSQATTTTAFLLKPQYEALLSEGQRQLRDSIVEFSKSVPQAARDAPEWFVYQYKKKKKLYLTLSFICRQRVQQMMKELGEGEDSHFNFVVTPKV